MKLIKKLFITYTLAANYAFADCNAKNNLVDSINIDYLLKSRMPIIEVLLKQLGDQTSNNSTLNNNSFNGTTNPDSLTIENDVLLDKNQTACSAGHKTDEFTRNFEEKTDDPIYKSYHRIIDQHLEANEDLIDVRQFFSYMYITYNKLKNISIDEDILALDMHIIMSKLADRYDITSKIINVLKMNVVIMAVSKQDRAMREITDIFCNTNSRFTLYSQLRHSNRYGGLLEDDSNKNFQRKNKYVDTCKRILNTDINLFEPILFSHNLEYTGMNAYDKLIATIKLPEEPDNALDKHENTVKKMYFQYFYEVGQLRNGTKSYSYNCQIETIDRYIKMMESKLIGEDGFDIGSIAFKYLIEKIVTEQKIDLLYSYLLNGEGSFAQNLYIYSIGKAAKNSSELDFKYVFVADYSKFKKNYNNLKFVLKVAQEYTEDENNLNQNSVTTVANCHLPSKQNEVIDKLDRLVYAILDIKYMDEHKDDFVGCANLINFNIDHVDLTSLAYAYNKLLNTPWLGTLKKLCTITKHSNSHFCNVMLNTH